MRKLSLTLLAASTMLIAGVAAAQPAPGAHPGATWRGGNVQMRAPNMQMRGPNVQMRGPNVQMRGPNMQMHGGQMRGGGNFGFHRWGPHPGRNFRHQRLRRGFVINPFWFGPQFHLNNWQVYGFSSPGADQRWVRYYDDAYLIDGHGRVLDERYGVDWSEYGEEWGDDGGIPARRGERHAGDGEGQAYEEHSEHSEHRGHQGGAMMPPPGYGGHGGHTSVYGGGYGYGYYAYPIVIETITTTGGGYTEEITEEYVETTRHRRRAHRPRRARCDCVRPAPRPAVRRPAPRPAPRPRPPAGERG